MKDDGASIKEAGQNYYTEQPKTGDFGGGSSSSRIMTLNLRLDLQ